MRLAPSYGTRYALSLARRYVVHDHRVRTWGPRYPGIDEDVHSGELLKVCARQWKHSVESACTAFAELGGPVVEVRYEHLVADPSATVTSVVSGLGLPLDAHRLETATSVLVSARQGTGERALTDAELAMLDGEIGSTLNDLGYELPSSRRAPGADRA